MTKSMSICSLHFKRDDYINADLSSKKRYLKRNVVPSCNLPKLKQISTPENTSLSRLERAKKRNENIVKRCLNFDEQIVENGEVNKNDISENSLSKFMTCVTPAGIISFISQGYGGRASDKFIFENSNVIDLLDENDAIMADKGFLINSLCAKNMLSMSQYCGILYDSNNEEHGYEVGDAANDDDDDDDNNDEDDDDDDNNEDYIE
ncbi:chaperonin CPN60, mitochondrial-like [Aphis gossypii]|uniref:chaperonin CPN60, mitochondrial-like n=1 Tax=Aphis gossypii TaxID=80765 RepID=UPI002158DD5F|nr:chaperonin CPN60, mitochondrial-like [Aphis gossypii]